MKKKKKVFGKKTKIEEEVNGFDFNNITMWESNIEIFFDFH